jgi:hypothetical protein
MSIWTPAMQERMLVLLQYPEVTYRQVAEALNAEFGCRLTKNSCIGRGRRLGVPPRPVRHHVEVVMPVPPRTPPPKPRKRPAYDQFELIDLGHDTCRWPIGPAYDPPPYHYCGRPRMQGAYCAEHGKKAYNYTRNLTVPRVPA